MARALRQVCVYCGAAWGARRSYATAARDLGRELARRGIILIYGGGKIGLMGEIADAAMAQGGQTIGVITQELVKKEVGHDRITELRVVETMHQRKKMMADLADAFIALPGGFGTFDELFEILTWAQLGLHDKPVGLLDTNGFYSGLMNFLDHASAGRHALAGSPSVASTGR
ncbi:TIGR00730 family Rossman fold protein [Leptolyngbya sp. 15MV]|nr:TIGR00730 family Rossman fold protein [Leptolyngbya sp. 15MV]